MSFLHPRKQRPAREVAALDLPGDASAVQGLGRVGLFNLGRKPAEPVGALQAAGRDAVASGVSHADHDARPAGGGAMRNGRTTLARRGKKAADFCAEAAKSLAARAHRWWRSKYGRKVRENVAADYGICVRQAGNWLRHGPGRHLPAVIIREGMDFVRAVIHPLAGGDDGRPRLQFRRRREVA